MQPANMQQVRSARVVLEDYICRSGQRGSSSVSLGRRRELQHTFMRGSSPLPVQAEALIRAEDLV